MRGSWDAPKMRFSVTPITATDEALPSLNVSRAKRSGAKPEQGAVMLKTIAAIVAAAAIAAAITVISAPIGDVVASPLPKPAADAIAACKQNPWPYVHCVGTEFGNPKIRLISIDHPSR